MAAPSSLPDRTEPLLCYYVNATQQIQLARLINSSSGNAEQVVFPGQRWLFEAVPEAWLEVGSAAKPSPERISCKCLRVKQGSSLSLTISDGIVE